MAWKVRFQDDFEAEFANLDPVVQDEFLARAKLLQEFGPALARPHADTLNGSNYANMKELRFDAAGGVWRAAFAFSPEREAVLLVVGDKSGESEKTFYKRLIKKADSRYSQHLDAIKAQTNKKAKKGK